MSKYQEVIEYLKKNQHTWLITGVAGFIGSNLLETLLKLNQKIIGLDNFSTGHQHNIDKAMHDAGSDLDGAKFQLINGDITNLEICKQACTQSSCSWSKAS